MYGLCFLAVSNEARKCTTIMHDIPETAVSWLTSAPIYTYMYMLRDLGDWSGDYVQGICS